MVNVENEDADAASDKQPDLCRLVVGIGALELINASSSASITSLKRLVLFEQLDVAGEVSLLLPLPFSENGDTSVRDSAVEASEAVDNVDWEDCGRQMSCPSCVTLWMSHEEGHTFSLGGLMEMIAQDMKSFLKRYLFVAVPIYRIETKQSDSLQRIRR